MKKLKKITKPPWLTSFEVPPGFGIFHMASIKAILDENRALRKKLAGPKKKPRKKAKP